MTGGCSASRCTRNFPTHPWVYVLYTYDAPPGQTAPVWNDDCSRGRRRQRRPVRGHRPAVPPAGGRQRDDRQPSRCCCTTGASSTPATRSATCASAPDGALYVSSGDGASFSAVDYGQLGTPANPCGDPPGGTMTPPSAQGGALRSQDVRTLGRPDRPRRHDPAARPGHRRGRGRQPADRQRRPERPADRRARACATRSGSPSGPAPASCGSATWAGTPGRRSTG